MVVASEQRLYQAIVLPRNLATGSLHDYLFCYCPLVGNLFEVLRIDAPQYNLDLTYSVLMLCKAKQIANVPS